MHKILLAAVAAGALSIAGVPAFAEDTQCPQGTTATTPTDGSPVTCQADDSVDDANLAPEGNSEGAAQKQGDSPLDTTDAGQGVKDAVTNAGNNGGGG